VKFEMGTKLYEAGKYKSNKPFEQMHQENLRLKSCFTCLHSRIIKQVLFGYQFESFVSGYPKSEKSTGSCLFRSKKLDDYHRCTA
jgi:outer membrane protein assembly factor BamD